jgi:hypothetical protein
MTKPSSATAEAAESTIDSLPLYAMPFLAAAVLQAPLVGFGLVSPNVGRSICLHSGAVAIVLMAFFGTVRLFAALLAQRR